MGYRVLDPHEEARRKRTTLLVIKVKPGIRVEEGSEDGGGPGIAVAISEMAVKINEWKSSLFFSSILDGTKRPAGPRRARVDEPGYVGCSNNKNESSS